MRKVALVLSVVAAACSRQQGPTPAGAVQPGRQALSDNPIAAENALPGTGAWALSQAANFGELEGYASDTSVNHGGALEIHARADGPHQATWELYRMGYYGGQSGRLVTSGGPFDVGPQDTPAADPVTGLVECNWPTSFVLQTQAAWTSGVYLLKLIRDDGPQSYVPIIVRADERKSVAVVQASVTTWQAYNDWGGESLYTDSIGLTGSHAREVSFNRPYSLGRGAGEYFLYEHYLVQWLEARGYDLTYVTNVDLDRDPSLATSQRLFVSSGHDEYWSRRERSAVEGALATGTSVAFLTADEAYWQIRLEPSRVDGRPGRTEVCYKDEAPAEDPKANTNLITMRWRDPQVGQPENALQGVMSDGWEFADLPWIVSGAGSWVYAGTGVRDGDTIPLMVGYESDRFFANGAAPASVTLLSRSPVLDFDVPSVSQHNASVYTAASGAFVFDAAVVQWAFGLSSPGLADARIQRMTDNVFQHAGLSPALAGDSFGAGAAHPVDTSFSASRVTTLAGAAGVEALVDGPAAQARFNRPIGIAADPDGTLFVADAGNHAVRRIDPQGNVTTLVAGLGLPCGIAAGSDGALYVTDLQLHLVWRVGRDGSSSVFAGGGGSGYVDDAGASAAFYLPAGIAAVGSDLYVADSGNSALRRIDSSGNVTTLLRGTVYRPTGLTWDGNALDVVDTGNRVIAAVGLDGSYAALAGIAQAGGYADGAAGSAQLMPLFGIAASGGTLLVTDTGNERLRAIAAGSVTTFAGNGNAAPADGPGTAATLHLPTGIAQLPDGSFAVVANGDSTIRLVRR